ARPAGVVGGDVDVLADAPLRGLDEQDALLAAQPPDDARIDPFDYLDDLPLGAAAVVDAGFADHDTIAVQHLLHLVRAEVQILAFVRHDEAIALRVPPPPSAPAPPPPRGRPWARPGWGAASAPPGTPPWGWGGFCPPRPRGGPRRWRGSRWAGVTGGRWAGWGWGSGTPAWAGV